jgi:hypothetical protein
MPPQHVLFEPPHVLIEKSGRRPGHARLADIDRPPPPGPLIEFPEYPLVRIPDCTFGKNVDN